MKSPKDRDARSVGEKFRAARAESALARQVSRERTRVERARDALEAIEVEKNLGRSLFVEYERPRKAVLARLDATEVRAGEARLLSDVHLCVEREARIRVAGGNGAGKTTLLRRLLEEAQLPAERVLHLPQHTTEAVERRWLDELGTLGRDARGRACSLLAALGTDPSRVLDSGRPSPGEARKIALATALGRHAWLLVLDEPTNHLDLPCVERLEAALERFPGAIVLVSHDDAFAERLTSVTWTLQGGRVELE
ncbi:MAG: ATP-binding cassette domain-containing protein [Polyangiaceae bacterium]